MEMIAKLDQNKTSATRTLMNDNKKIIEMIF